MKTLELKLKKDVLIVDKNDFKYYTIIDNEIIFNIEDVRLLRIKGDYEFICLGSELTEEIASEFFEHDDFLNCFETYIDTVPSIDKSALKLFIKIFESKGFYWLENPIEKPKYYDKILTKNCLIWHESEEKTFRNPLIFVKK